MKSFFLVLAALALVLNLGAGLAFGIARPMESDAHHFALLARSLAAGQGYVDSGTFWPDTPSLQRMPLWPFVGSLVLRAFPACPADAILRVLALLLNAVNVLLVGVLAQRVLGGVRWAGVLAGAIYLANPTGIFLAVTGMSEPLYVFVVLGGLLLIVGVRSGWWCALPVRLVGCLLMGVAALDRANHVLWALLFAGMLVLARFRGVMGAGAGRMDAEGNGDARTGGAGPSCAMGVGTLIVAVVLGLLPPVLWMARNAAVSGEWPVLSTLRGQTFYGGNNPVTASPGEFWGYWVFPDAIPGERPLAALAPELGEVGVDRHYFAKGVAYLRENPTRVPVLMLGKLIRAYVPVPWKPTTATLVLSAYRWVLYVAAGFGLWWWWRRTPVLFRAGLLAMIGTNVVTVLLFWGYARFAFVLEPLWAVFAAGAIVVVCDRRACHHGSR